jgi:hypothetical protein
MPDMVGSVAVALDPRAAAVAAVGRLSAGMIGGAAGAGGDTGLAWQTTIGHVVFLQSVVHEPV